MIQKKIVTKKMFHFNPIALRKARIVCNYGLSECSRVKSHWTKSRLVIESEDKLKTSSLEKIDE